MIMKYNIVIYCCLANIFMDRVGSAKLVPCIDRFGHSGAKLVFFSGWAESLPSREAGLSSLI